MLTLLLARSSLTLLPHKQVAYEFVPTPSSSPFLVVQLKCNFRVHPSTTSSSLALILSRLAPTHSSCTLVESLVDANGSRALRTWNSEESSSYLHAGAESYEEELGGRGVAIWARFKVLAPMLGMVPFRSCAGFAVEVRLSFLHLACH